MLALPAMAAVVVYLPTLPGGFLSDDYSLLHMFYGADAREVAARVGKTFVSGVGPPSNQYRPLTMATFAANTLLNGADVAGWRVVNIALHAANAALVALLLLLGTALPVVASIRADDLMACCRVKGAHGCMLKMKHGGDETSLRSAASRSLRDP